MAKRRGEDQAWVMREALARHKGGALLVTITAPGRDVLPYLADGKTLDSYHLTQWCATLSARWRALNNKARTYALRRSKASSGRTVLSYAWQLQARGAPHVHLAVCAGDVGRRYASALIELAPSYGFGFGSIRKGGGSASAVGSYLSRYLSRDLASESTRLPARPAYVNPEIARHAGVSVRIARGIRRLWVYANVDRDPRLIGGKEFSDETFRSWVYYWYRVNRRGRENVPDPVVAKGW